MKLHLGCGEKIITGYINIDTRALPGVDVIDDIGKLDNFDNETVELIYVSHVLEHFSRREYMAVLTRWYNLLNEGGILRLAIPDFEKVVEHYNKFKDIEMLRGFLYGGQNYKENYHYCAWDFDKLRNDLISIGFKSVKRYDWQTTEHAHIDDYSQCYLPHMDKEKGMLMSLNIEATK
jgi:hypothetical protein